MPCSPSPSPFLFVFCSLWTTAISFMSLKICQKWYLFLWLWVVVNFVDFFLLLLRRIHQLTFTLPTPYPETNVICILNCDVVFRLCFVLFRLLIRYVENNVFVCSTFVVGCNSFVIIIFWLLSVCVCLWRMTLTKWSLKRELLTYW